MPSLLSPTPHTPRQLQSETRHESPNYFGLVFDNGNSEPVLSPGARIPNGTWSPPNSSIRSVAATSPQMMPANENPDFEAFRKQSSQLHFGLSQGTIPTLNSLQRKMSIPKPPLSRKTTAQDTALPRAPKTIPIHIQKAETIASSDILRSSRSPKRLLSNDSVATDRPRTESPTTYGASLAPERSGSPPCRHDDKHPRLSPPKGDEKRDLHNFRAETLPLSIDAPGPNLATPQNIVNILDSSDEEVLLLDLRVSTQYARSRIAGALNLCVPTTLLKRATYNVERLADTFKDQGQRGKFETWKKCKYIIVYDTNASQLKEATNCINILKKFLAEGWDANSCIIRGGFQEFARKFPTYIDEGTTDNSGNSSTISLSLKGAGANIPPVIGGCPMPITKSAANPFFGNIRQNMDLIGGVGQMPVNAPASMTKVDEGRLPSWLTGAAAPSDNGKAVSDKFLEIEKREQKRMQDALSGNVHYGTPTPGASRNVQIAGIEKGSKNRYNNIWPYEHSRVKLKDVSKDECDYVNANFLKTSRSNKKYIATQGPIPTTFNDFWSMVWQRDIRVIVMLTAETEGGQVKAHNYWNQRTYGHAHLKFLSEHRASLEPSKIHRHRPSLNGRRSTNRATSSNSISSSANSESQGTPTTKQVAPPSNDNPYVIVRKFTLSNDAHPFDRMREITQLQYSSWPDFGAPAHPAHLLGLVEQCDAVVRNIPRDEAAATGPDPPSQRPVLVHCSAGCGRTGTFCTVDSVVDMLKRQRISGDGGRSASQATTPMDVDAKVSSKTIKADGSSGVPTLGPLLDTNPKTGLDEDWLGRDDVDLVEKTVEELRLQRLSMVQSLRQFVLCYETVMEWLVSQSHSEQEQKQEAEQQQQQHQHQASQGREQQGQQTPNLKAT